MLGVAGAIIQSNSKFLSATNLPTLFSVRCKSRVKKFKVRPAPENVKKWRELNKYRQDTLRFFGPLVGRKPSQSAVKYEGLVFRQRGYIIDGADPDSQEFPYPELLPKNFGIEELIEQSKWAAWQHGILLTPEDTESHEDTIHPTTEKNEKETTPNDVSATSTNITTNSPTDAYEETHEVIELVCTAEPCMW